MTTHTHSSTATQSVRHSLTDAALRADRRLAQAAHASDRVHRQVERALQHGGAALEGQAARERRWPGRVDPLVDRLSSKAQQLARHSLDLAADAGSKAQASWSNYAQATHAYVARQPLRSVLIAAAVGAGLTLLLAAGRKRG